MAISKKEKFGVGTEWSSVETKSWAAYVTSLFFLISKSYVAVLANSFNQ